MSMSYDELDGNFDPNAYKQIKDMLQKEKEEALLRQADKLAALERALMISEAEDTDDFEIGGAL